MAFTDQCKFAFRANAQGLLGKQKKKNVTKVLKELAEDSDISFKTLERWWYEGQQAAGKDNPLKNEGTGEESCPNNEPTGEIPICIRCNINQIEIGSRTKKPLPRESLYYGLCSPCRKRHTQIKKLDENADKDGLMTICPTCNHAHYVSVDRIEKIIDERLKKMEELKNG